MLVERAVQPEGRWVAYGRGGQPMTLAWKRRTETVRATQPLKWRGTVTQVVGLGEETSPVTATVRVEVRRGSATSIDVAIADGLVVNQVSGAMVADWEFRPGALRVTFLEPVTTQTSLAIAGEARIPREGVGDDPARASAGGRARNRWRRGGGARRRRDRRRQASGLDPADPSDLGEPLRGRESPSMMAFRYRPQVGARRAASRVDVARYTPQAVLIANVEEARYDALFAEEGKMLVRARYAVRNNQRAFLAVTLPEGATLWSASVAGRPLRPGVSPGGALLLPLEKGRAREMRRRRSPSK